MVVGHLSELISATVGSEKRHVWLRRPRASRALVRGESVGYSLSQVAHKWHVGQR